tara:strand:- start:109 stop:477 length:369 start_codon:yes stop_codon:yes gene_type:complete
MSKGVKWPLQVTGRGGLTQTSDNIESLLALALLPRRSSNPFNRRDGIGSPDWTWRAVTPTSLAQVKRRVAQVFDRFHVAGRAKLVSVNVEPQNVDGELQVSVAWVDLGSGLSQSTVVSTGAV